MKRLYTLLLVALFSSAFYPPLYAQGTWTEKTIFGGGGRERCVAFSIGNYGYVGTGLQGETAAFNEGTNDFWQYDPTFDTWSQIQDFPGTPRFNAVAFSIGTKGYVGLGTDSSSFKSFNDFWAYDVNSNQWNQVANFGGPGRAAGIAFTINGIGYVGTGDDDHTIYSDMWAYNPTLDTWKQKSDFGGGIYEFGSCFVINNTAYVCGGYGQSASNYAYAYNASTDTWTSIANFPGQTQLCMAFSDTAYGYAGGGDYFGQSDSSFYKYNPTTDSWSAIASYGGGPREAGSAFSIAGIGYVCNGSLNGPGNFEEEENDLWQFNPGLDITITTGTVSLSNCAGRTIIVPYFLSSSFPGDNIFTAQLSDASGSFANPVDIGDLFFADEGSIEADIPGNTVAGSGYRIRVISSTYNINGSDNGSDITINNCPTLPLIYGLTASGGMYGAGTIFSLDPATGRDSVLWNFGSSVSDGSGPAGNLTYDPDNQLFYGVTYAGGTFSNGTIFSFNPANNTYQQVYSFGIGTDGIQPENTLVYNTANRLFYGVTFAGGSNDANFGGDGTIFSFDPNSNTETVLWNFGNNNQDGIDPGSDLVYDKDNGLYYEITEFSENLTFPNGAIVSFDPATNTENVVWNFNNTPDADPVSGANMVYDAGSKLFYGTTAAGGSNNPVPGGYGTIFSFDPSTNAEKVLWDFGSGADGIAPGGMIRDSINGLYYGTTINGGTSGSVGTVFSYNPTTNAETVLYNFNAGLQDGVFPTGNLVYDAAGGLFYGVTTDGGNYNNGTVFTLDPVTNTENIVWSFGVGAFDGLSPTGLVLFPSNNSSSDNITTGTISPTTYCSGKGVSVPYTVSGTFNIANVFTAQLSDANGSFSNPVNIGSLPVSTAGTIYATIPDNTIAGTGYRIRVVCSNPSANSTDNGNDITINTSPASTISATSPVCLGTASTITYTGTPISGATYTWNFNGGTGGVAGEGPQTITWAIAGTYIPTLSVSANGCISLTTGTAKVIVSPPYTSSFTATSPVCGASTITYTGNAPVGATYNWSFGSGSGGIPGATSQAITWPAAGTYTVTLSVGSGACQSTVTSHAVVVNNKPSSAFTATSPECIGFASTLTYTGTIIPGATYTWNFNGGTGGVAGATNQALTWLTAGTYTPTLIVSANGCTSSISSDPVTILGFYTSSFTAPATVCGTGTQATISYTGNAPPGADYIWDFGSGSTVVSGSGQGPYKISWLTTGSKTISLSLSNGPCQSALVSHTVQVNAAPTAPFSINSDTACTGINSVITYTGNADTAAVFNWNFNGAKAVPGTGGGKQTVTWPASGRFTISLTVSDNGCTSAGVTLPVTVGNTYTSTFDVSSPTICSLDSVEFFTYTGNAPSQPILSWNVGNANLVDSLLTPTVLPLLWTTPGTKTVSLTVWDGGVCISPVTTHTVQVNILPAATFIADHDSICTGAGVKFTYTGTPDSGATYAWIFPGGAPATSTAKGPLTVTWTQAGTYHPILIVSNGSCTATDSITIIVGTGAAVVTAKAGTAATANQLTANWNVSAGATGYYLDVSLHNNFSSFVTGYNNLSVGNVTSRNVTGLTPGTAYYYRVRAKGSCGTGANSNTITYATTTCATLTAGTVAPVSSIICPGGTKSLALSGASGGTLQWQISGDNINWSNVSSGGTTSTYTTLSADGASKKYYRCVSSNACYNAASTSVIVDVSTPNITITASNITDNGFTLNWSPVGSGNYSVSYSGPSTGSLTGITPPKTFSGLSAGSTYAVTVTQSAPAGCPSSGTLTGLTTLCGAPTNLKVTATTATSISLSWTGPTGNYKVYYTQLFTSSHVTQTQNVTNATTATLSSLVQGASYQIYVVSQNCGATAGQPSGYVTGTTTTTTTCTGTPVIDSVKTTCSSRVQVWVHGSASNQYKIYLQPILPVMQATNVYTTSGSNFSVSVAAGQTFLIAAASVCPTAVSKLTIWPQSVVVPATCGAVSNVVISQPSCVGFTASWNADNCTSSTLNSYLLSIRKQGTIAWSSYSVSPATTFKVVNWLTPNTGYQCFLRSAYNCGTYVTYGPSSQTQTVATLSSGCRIEEEGSPAEMPAPPVSTGNAEESFSLYPNPNTGEFIIDFSRINPDEEQVRIEVINLLGQTMLTHITSIADGHLNEFITMPANCASGIYFVRLTAGNKIYNSEIDVSK